MDAEFVQIGDRQLVPGWEARITSNALPGALPTSESEVYTAVRSLLRLSDNDLTLHVLAPLLQPVPGGELWLVPLDALAMAQLLRRGGDVHWVVGGCTVRVDVSGRFA